MARCHDDRADFYFPKRRFGFELNCVGLARLGALTTIDAVLCIDRIPIRYGLWKRLVDSFSCSCVGVPPIWHFDWTNGRTLPAARTSVTNALWFDFDVDVEVTSSSVYVGNFSVS